MVLLFDERRFCADGRRPLRDKRPDSHKQSAAAAAVAAIIAERPDDRRRDERRSVVLCGVLSSSVDKSVRDPLAARECASATASCTDRR
ncbi:unnamed protein product [Strongylus vulgaris]|uniref:Uncharacterized protein n=1 Tax=Strongylus vulgaris TaxID=40348 RepID=A0A3P7LQ80_STRVU|nr:unnamed protein product [Strongylus vulgaris]